MATFNAATFENLLAPYLSKVEKGRLVKSLEQFKKKDLSDNVIEEINYSRFYISSPKTKHFEQGDLLNEIRNPEWDSNTAQYHKKYPTSLVLSNTCDLYDENLRVIPKEALFAPSVELNVYLKFLLDKGVEKAKIDLIEKNIKIQNYSNLFYLPPNLSDKKEYVILFDRIFWFPNQELKTYLDNITANRISSLHYFGHYLLLIKLSYHFCRIPEGDDKEIEKKAHSVRALFDKLRAFLFRN